MPYNLGAANFALNVTGINSARQQIASLGQQLMGLVNPFHTVGRLISTVLGGAAIGSLVRLSAQMEDTRISFEAFFSSAAKTEVWLKKLRKWADFTPMSEEQTYGAARMLLSFGRAAEKIIDDLQMLGDVASGTQRSITELAYTYGVMSRSQRVYNMHLRMLQMKGVPIYEELAKVLKTSVNAVGELANRGRVSFAHVQAAFKGMTDLGGKFHKSMYKLSTTLSAWWTGFKDVLTTNILRPFGDAIVKAFKLKEGLSGITEWMKKFAESARFKRIVLEFERFLTKVYDARQQIWGITKAVLIVVALFKSFSFAKSTVAGIMLAFKAWPITLIVSGLLSLAWVFSKIRGMGFADYIDTLGDEFLSFGKRLFDVLVTIVQDWKETWTDLKNWTIALIDKIPFVGKQLGIEFKPTSRVWDAVERLMQGGPATTTQTASEGGSGPLFDRWGRRFGEEVRDAMWNVYSMRAKAGEGGKYPSDLSARGLSPKAGPPSLLSDWMSTLWPQALLAKKAGEALMDTWIGSYHTGEYLVELMKAKYADVQKGLDSIATGTKRTARKVADVYYETVVGSMVQGLLTIKEKAKDALTTASFAVDRAGRRAKTAVADAYWDRIIGPLSNVFEDIIQQGQGFKREQAVEEKQKADQRALEELRRAAGPVPALTQREARWRSTYNMDPYGRDKPERFQAQIPTSRLTDPFLLMREYLPEMTDLVSQAAAQVSDIAISFDDFYIAANNARTTFPEVTDAVKTFTDGALKTRALLHPHNFELTRRLVQTQTSREALQRHVGEVPASRSYYEQLSFSQQAQAMRLYTAGKLGREGPEKPRTQFDVSDPGTWSNAIADLTRSLIDSQMRSRFADQIPQWDKFVEEQNRESSRIRTEARERAKQDSVERAHVTAQRSRRSRLTPGWTLAADTAGIGGADSLRGRVARRTREDTERERRLTTPGANITFFDEQGNPTTVSPSKARAQIKKSVEFLTKEQHAANQRFETQRIMTAQGVELAGVHARAAKGAQFQTPGIGGKKGAELIPGTYQDYLDAIKRIADSKRLTEPQKAFTQMGETMKRLGLITEGAGTIFQTFYHYASQGTSDINKTKVAFNVLATTYQRAGRDGKITWTEFNRLQKLSPGLLKNTAEAMGLTTVQLEKQLKARKGGVSPEKVMEGMTKGAEAAIKAAEATEKANAGPTLEQSKERLLEFDEKISQLKEMRKKAIASGQDTEGIDDRIKQLEGNRKKVHQTVAKGDREEKLASQKKQLQDNRAMLAGAGRGAGKGTKEGGWGFAGISDVQIRTGTLGRLGAEMGRAAKSKEDKMMGYQQQTAAGMERLTSLIDGNAGLKVNVNNPDDIGARVAPGGPR